MTQYSPEIGVPIYDDTPNSVLILFRKVVECLYQKDYNLATNLCNIEIKNLNKTSGVFCFDPAISVFTILAIVYLEMGDYEGTIEFLHFILILQELKYGKKHSTIATTCNNLAVCDIKRGKDKRAEKLFKRVISKAYKNESGDTNKKSKLLMLTFTKMIGISKDSIKSTNIWQIAEERERNKGTRYEAAPPVWFKSADLDSPTFNMALNGLAFLYEKSCKSVAAETLRYFGNQQRTDTAETTSSVGYRIVTRSELPPPLPPRLQGASHRSVASSSGLPLPTPAPRHYLVQTYHFEKMIAEMKAEIAEKAQQLDEALRAIETHGAYCSICKTEVANRMWSRCSHLAACKECAETYNDSVADEFRSRDGIACPKCRTHGHPLPVFI